MKKIFLIIAFALLISSCGTPVSTAIPTGTSAPVETRSSNTKTPKPRVQQSEPTFPPPTRTKTPIPTITPTPQATADAEGNITWHPQPVLIISESGGGDGGGIDLHPPEFLLLWDGTLYQPGPSGPYVSQLSTKEVCLLLNTIDASGFFEENADYYFPFDGLPSKYISVNSWKANSSGSQVLSHALSGAPYYDGLFCRDCPIPSAETIIHPGLANAYYLLKNYYSPNRSIAKVDKLKLQLLVVEEPSTAVWPLSTITATEFFNKCVEEECFDIAMTLDGDIAFEIMNNAGMDQIYEAETQYGHLSFRLSYRSAWPYEPSIMYWRNEPDLLPEVPADFTMTCNPSMGQYPILSLNPQSEFWYYAPDGTWGAELVNTPDQPKQIRIVNNGGYEKYFNYEPNLFKRESINVFPRYWSKDGRYFFANVVPSDFNYRNTPFVNSLGLQRISIENGKAQYIFIGTEGESFAYGISNNGLQSAHIQQEEQPLKIVLTDLDTLKQQSAVLLTPGNEITYTAAGTIVWSKDGNFLFVAANYLEDGKVKSAIIKIDVTNPAYQSIVNQIDSAIKLVHFASWENEAGICPLDASMGEYCEARLDLTNESN